MPVNTHIKRLYHLISVLLRMTLVILLNAAFLSAVIDGPDGMVCVEYETEQLQEVYRGLMVGEVDHFSYPTYKLLQEADNSRCNATPFDFLVATNLSPYLEIHSPPPDIDAFLLS